MKPNRAPMSVDSYTDSTGVEHEIVVYGRRVTTPVFPGGVMQGVVPSDVYIDDVRWDGYDDDGPIGSPVALAKAHIEDSIKKRSTQQP